MAPCELPPAFSSARRASTSVSSPRSSSSLNCASRLEAASSAWPRTTRLFTADLVFEAADLARRVEDVDRLHGVLHLSLRVGRLRAGDELGALVLELDQLLLHAVEARLQLVDDLGLRGDLRLGGLRLVLGRDLAAEGDLREVVELVGVCRIAGCTELIALAARREGLLAPLARGFDVFAVIVFEQAQVADGLGDRGLGVGDRVREVAHDLVQHQLGVLGLVDEAVDVGSQQLRDPSEDGLLCHGRSFRGDRRSSESVEMWMRVGTFSDRFGRPVDPLPLAGASRACASESASAPASRARSGAAEAAGRTAAAAEATASAAASSETAEAAAAPAAAEYRIDEDAAEHGSEEVTAPAAARRRAAESAAEAAPAAEPADVLLGERERGARQLFGPLGGRERAGGIGRARSPRLRRAIDPPPRAACAPRRRRLRAGPRGSPQPPAPALARPRATG